MKNIICNYNNAANIFIWFKYICQHRFLGRISRYCRHIKRILFNVVIIINFVHSNKHNFTRTFLPPVSLWEIDDSVHEKKYAFGWSILILSNRWVYVNRARFVLIWKVIILIGTWVQLSGKKGVLVLFLIFSKKSVDCQKHLKIIIIPIQYTYIY